MDNKDMEKKDYYKENAKGSNSGKEKIEEDNDSDSSLDNQELINTINYNTITSLAALKDILQGDATNTIEADNFFQHYFLNHCNNLSSRNSISPFHYPERRRLSQCREEDEDNEKTKKESDLPSTSQTKHKTPKPQKTKYSKEISHFKDDEGGEFASDESMDNDESQKRTVVGVKHKFLVTPTQPKEEAVEKPLSPQSHNAHTVHFGTKGVEEIRPNVKTIFDPLNLRRDKKYFDSSLIEIRSKVEDLETTRLTEDIWVKREDPKPKPAKRAVRVAEESANTSETSKGARPRRVSLDDVGRARASSFSSRKDRGIIRKFSSDKKEKKKKSKDDTDGLSWSSQSGTEKQDWGSADDVGNTMYQQTIHGTSGVSRRPALFDSFKSSKKGESKRQTSLIQQVVEAVQSIGKSSEKEEKVKKKEINHETKKENKVTYKPTTRDGSAHPHAGSDAKYYHTMTAGAQRRPSAIAKVMDVFRSRPSSANEAADRRKARAIQQQLQQNSAGAKIIQDVERRRSLGQLPRQPIPMDPYRAAVLARDENGVVVVIPYLDKDSKLSREEDEAQIFVKFFKYHTCYDLMPTSAKLVIFDTKLRVKKAFFALVDNGVRAAPLWDSYHQQFVGMLTITDFIKILQMYYTSPNVTMDELEEHRLETWRAVLKGSTIPLVSIGPKSSLLDAIKILISNKIHRLPVIDPDTGDVIHILTHKRILRFLFLYINDIPKPAYLNRKIRDLRIGTLNDIETATEDTLIIEALTKFVNRRVSALPIVDMEGRLKDIYAKFDVINLAAEKTYNDLNVTLKKANEHRNAWFEGVQKCTLDETLYEVMERIVKAEVHRLVVVDEEDRVTGIISLSDLLQYIALRPSEAPVNRPLKTLHSASIDEAEENQEDHSEEDTVTKDDSSDTDNTEVADNQDSADENTKTLGPDDKNGVKTPDDDEK